MCLDTPHFHPTFSSSIFRISFAYLIADLCTFGAFHRKSLPVEFRLRNVFPRRIECQNLRALMNDPAACHALASGDFR
jgi:hypothetical protein